MVVEVRPLRSSAASWKLQLGPGYEQADLLIGMSLFELDTTLYGWRVVGDDFLEELGAIATAIAAGQVTERLLLYRGDASPLECTIELGAGLNRHYKTGDGRIPRGGGEEHLIEYDAYC